ncbi:MAG: MFS transporter [Pseudomonadota bacterium]
MMLNWLTDPVRRNVVLLAFCQAFFMCVQTMAIATTPLAAHGLLGTDKSLATLPLVLTHSGIMLATIPASFLMAKIGRRGGFSVGAMIGIISGLLSVYAIYEQSFVLLCIGALLQGISAAFAWYFRFAAADAADDAFRPHAISLVMAGGVLAGLLGPETAKHAANWLEPVLFAGVYVMSAVYAAMVLLLVQGLRIPSLAPEVAAKPGRPIREIARQPTYVVALMSSMFGYGVMTLVMSATPLAMLACGFNFGASATVIQAHVVAMFLPSFFTGKLIQRYGVLPIIICGAFIQVGCAAVNLAGIEFYNFFVANILVGLGWNFTYVGGSTLLTRTYRPEERAKVQASHDFLVYATTAIAAGLSGVLQAQVGWSVVNIAAIPLMLLVATAALWLMRYERREQAARSVAAE